MARVMNTVFGIGIAVILFIVVMLGTQVFYKEPMADSSQFNCTSYYQTTPILDYYSCPDNITVRDCNVLIKNQTLVENIKQQECWNKLNEAQKIYGKNLFIINNVIGIIFVIVSLFLFAMTNIAAGAAFSGLALIIYGFMRGWQGTGDTLKFFVSLIVAILFIIFAVLVNKRYSKLDKKK